MTTTARLEGTILVTDDAINAHVEDWDRLTIASSRPATAPAIGLAWLRHCVPPGSEPRIVAVHDGRRLVGVAPYVAQHGRGTRTDYRLLGSGIFHRLGVLAEAGAEHDVALAVTAALHDALPSPSLVTLEGIGASPDWQTLLADTYPGRLHPRRYTSSVHPAPVVNLAGRSFDQWLASKSSNFRQQARNLRRRADAQGASIRLATADSLERDLTAFARLHHLHWDATHSGTFLNVGIERMLADAASELIRDNRFRLWLVELGGEPVGSLIFIEAGGELAYWNGGYDPSFAKVRPGFLLMLQAIEEACEDGVNRIDLGGGDHDYKLRFADTNDPIVWCGLMPRTPRYPLVRAQMLPSELSWLGRRAAKRVLRRVR